MRVCLNAWQDQAQLDKADELKVIWEKREIIPNIFEQYPEDKIVVLECLEHELTEKDWEDLKLYKGLSKGRFKVCAASLELFYNSGIPFYMGYPVTDLYSLRGLVDLGVTDVKVAGSLIFNLREVRACIAEAPAAIRVAPNIAYTDGIPRKNGIIGGWIRPEDITMYDDLIDIIEFEDIPNKQKEQVLYRLYMEKHEWAGELQQLITNFNYPGLNRMIPSESSIARINCKQSCLKGGHCRLCYTMLSLADLELYKEKTHNE